jgi:formylglycine-generating enzyme required for sulfatase activity
MKWLKITLVVLFAGVLTAVGIDASDTIQGSNDTFLAQIIGSERGGVCGEGMVEVKTGLSFTCVDAFEASPSETCPHSDIQSELQTQENANEADCVPVSVKDALPWRYVSLAQAQQFCARAEKRLPTNEEWYIIAQGLSSVDSCTLFEKGGSPKQTGVNECVTPAGAYDVVGNVWEWVQGEVVDGTLEGKTVPDSGFVSLVDSSGTVLETTTVAKEEYGKDYAWTDKQGVKGIIRGGFFGSGEDGGLYTQNMAVPLDFRTGGLGFRCIR